MRHLKVHGTHENNQKLMFEMKLEEKTGKTMITVPLANQSKFGPAGFGKTEKQYHIVKLDDKELSKAMSEETKQELANIKRMSKLKEQSK